MSDAAILVVEDDRDLAQLINTNLSAGGFSCTLVHTGTAGLEAALASTFALIILDWMLPQLDGLEVCKELRKRGNTTPILMLTAKNEELDKILALELGADDYLTKPFSVKELLARLKALIRRAAIPSQPCTAIKIGDLELTPHKRRVTLAAELLELTEKEYELLYLLAANAGKVFSREDLLLRVWDYNSSAYEHTVTSHINRLRSKIEADPANPRYILTVWGVGYKFAEDAEVKS